MRRMFYILLALNGFIISAARASEADRFLGRWKDRNFDLVFTFENNNVLYVKVPDGRVFTGIWKAENNNIFVNYADNGTVYCVYRFSNDGNKFQTNLCFFNNDIFSRVSQESAAPSRVAPSVPSTPSPGNATTRTGKWLYAAEGAGAKLGFTRPKGAQELEGLVFYCGDKVSPIDTIIDLDSGFKVGASTEVVVKSGSKVLKAAGTAEDGPSGTNVSLRFNAPSVFELLNEHQDIIVETPDGKEAKYPSATAPFGSFIRRCGGKTK